MLQKGPPRQPDTLLEWLQESFRETPGGLTIEEVMGLLQPRPCEHGERADRCRKWCEDERLASVRVGSCRKRHGPYLPRQRPKWVRAKLEELIGLGLMHKEVSPEGFRYYAYEKLFDLFYGPIPAPEQCSLDQLSRHHGEGVWCSPDPNALRQLAAAKKEEYGAAYERRLQEAIELVDAGKMVCPYCQGTRHDVRYPDRAGDSLGSARCSGCEGEVRFRVLDAETIKAQGLFYCYFLDGGMHSRSASSKQELLASGWKSFFPHGRTFGERWACAACQSVQQQAARRAERPVAQVIDGKMSCPHCHGAEHRLAKASQRISHEDIEASIVRYGAYLYDALVGVCLNPRCLSTYQPLGSRQTIERTNTFYLPDDHRWRACSCGKHAEIPEHQASTLCGCGKTLWLNYEDESRS